MVNLNSERFARLGRSETSKPYKAGRRQGAAIMGLYLLMVSIVVFIVWVPAKGFLNQVANDIAPADTGNPWRELFVGFVFMAEFIAPAFAALWLGMRLLRISGVQPVNKETNSQDVQQT